MLTAGEAGKESTSCRPNELILGYTVVEPSAKLKGPTKITKNLINFLSAPNCSLSFSCSLAQQPLLSCFHFPKFHRPLWGPFSSLPLPRWDYQRFGRIAWKYCLVRWIFPLGSWMCFMWPQNCRYEWMNIVVGLCFLEVNGMFFIIFSGWDWVLPSIPVSAASAGTQLWQTGNWWFGQPWGGLEGLARCILTEITLC